jgi:hypothetical protein
VFGKLELPARLAALLAAAGLVLAPGLGLAESSSGETAREGGVGAGSALVSLVYGPTKILYATGGLIVGGLAFAFSGGDAEVAQVVLTPSVRGDYVVTPKHLRGEKEIEFFGRKPDYRPEVQEASVAGEADVASAAPADGW